MMNHQECNAFAFLPSEEPAVRNRRRRRPRIHRTPQWLVLVAILFASHLELVAGNSKDGIPANLLPHHHDESNKTKNPFPRFGPWFRSRLPKPFQNKNNNNINTKAGWESPLSQSAVLEQLNGIETTTIEEELEEEEDPWMQDTETETPLATAAPLAVGVGSALVDAILSNRQRLASWSITAVQYSVIWFLAQSLWKALKETMDEMTQETLGGDPTFCSRSDLVRLVSFLEQQKQQLSTTNKPASSSNTPLLLPAAALQLAQDLQNAGLPVRSHPASGISSIESLFQDMTRSEANILQQCLWRPPALVRDFPDELWDNVLGMDDVKENILLTVAAATTLPTPDSSSISDATEGNDTFVKDELYRSISHLQKTQQAYASLLSSRSERSSSSTSTSQHHGILLYGEPGCGKSFFVQALASKLRLPCLVVTPSVLMRKYVGDTNLQVRALFSLVQNKLFPCIVVLDELDGLFRERHDNEHDSSRELKTEFLQWLSGVMTTSSSSSRTNAASPRHPLIVVGATNRPMDVDSAILRRLPQRFYIGLPDFTTRCQLIDKMLQDIPLADDFQTEFLGQITDGYTPSDIRQVLQTAVRIGPIKEAIILGQQQQQHQNKGGSASSSNNEVRRLGTNDVQQAISRVGSTPLSRNYRHKLQQFANSNGVVRSQQLLPHNGHQQQQQQQQQGNPWGLHFANIGTVQAPFSASSPQQSLWEEPEEIRFEDNDVYDDSGSDYDEDDDADDEDEL